LRWIEADVIAIDADDLRPHADEPDEGGAAAMGMSVGWDEGAKIAA
jgi:hypothetical protein